MRAMLNPKRPANQSATLVLLDFAFGLCFAPPHQSPENTYKFTVEISTLLHLVEFGQQINLINLEGRMDIHTGMV